MSDKPLDTIAQPACANLLSKGMFVTGLLNPADNYIAMSDGYCWCNQTQNMLGPDDQMVERAACVPGRQCYIARI